MTLVISAHPQLSFVLVAQCGSPIANHSASLTIIELNCAEKSILPSLFFKILGFFSTYKFHMCPTQLLISSLMFDSIIIVSFNKIPISSHFENFEKHLSFQTFI